MTKYIRYTLAALCLAASVGCLALWWATLTERSRVMGPAHILHDEVLCLEFFNGTAYIFTEAVWAVPSRYTIKWHTWHHAIEEWRSEEFKQIVETGGQFGTIYPDELYFPLWYPALIFALAGVGILRVGRFTIRSALVVTAIVAALLGMVVAL